jgi:hypothetical protein
LGQRGVRRVGGISSRPAGTREGGAFRQFARRASARPSLAISPASTARRSRNRACLTASCNRVPPTRPIPRAVIPDRRGSIPIARAAAPPPPPAGSFSEGFRTTAPAPAAPSETLNKRRHTQCSKTPLVMSHRLRNIAPSECQYGFASREHLKKCSQSRSRELSF